MTSENDNFFDFCIILLKFGGVWVPDKNETTSLKTFYLLFNSCCLLYNVCFYVPSELVMLAYTYVNMEDFVKSLSMALTHVLAVCKAVIWFKQRKLILKIIDTLRNNTVDYEAIGDFDPQSILKRDKRILKFVSHLFLSLAVGVSLSACVTSSLVLLFSYEGLYVIADDGNGNNMTIYNQLLPYYSYIPWDYNASRFSFGMALLLQLSGIFYFAFTIVGFDLLFISMISYTSCQLRILQGAFRTIRQRCLVHLKLPQENVLHDSEELNAKLIEELTKGIKALQVIFEQCDLMENIFTNITLTQVMVSLLVLCTCLFQVSSEPVTSPEFPSHLIYLIAIEVQLSLYCTFGNMVTERADAIPLSLYEGDWLSASERFKKNMLMTMIRMRRPIHFTIGKFTPLTLSTFVTIGRGSYSVFAVLKK